MLLFRLDVTRPIVRPDALREGFTRHCAVAPLMHVLMQAAGRQQSYLMLDGCNGCAQNQCVPGCRVELMRRTCRAAFQTIGTLKPVPQGLARRPYTRITIALPTAQAQPLMGDILHPYADARLIVQLKPGRNHPTGAVVLLTGADGPDPAARMQAVGWKVVALPAFAHPYALGAYQRLAVPLYPFPGPWTLPVPVVLPMVVPLAAPQPEPVVTVDDAPFRPVGVRADVDPVSTTATPAPERESGGGADVVEETTSVVAPMVLCDDAGLPAIPAVDAGNAAETAVLDDSAPSDAAEQQRASDVAAMAQPISDEAVSDPAVPTAIAHAAEQDDITSSAPPPSVRARTYLHLRDILAGGAPLQRNATSPSGTDARPSVPVPLPAVTLAATASEPPDTALPEAADVLVAEPPSRWPSGPGTGKGHMTAEDVGMWIAALLVSSDISSGAEPGITRKRLVVHLQERHREHSALLLLWLDKAAVLTPPADVQTPYRRPRPLVSTDSDWLANRLHATPLPTLSDLTQARTRGL